MIDNNVNIKNKDKEPDYVGLKKEEHCSTQSGIMEQIVYTHMYMYLHFCLSS